MLKIMIIIISVILLLFTLYLLVLIRPGRKRDLNGFFLTEYAHRGLHDKTKPENSLAAFKAAVDKGYGIELDLQLSSDGEVMVFHDYSLERMTGRKNKLSELTSSELKGLKLGESEERIPYLREVLEAVDGKVPILIEMKGESFSSAVCVKANEILKNYSGDYVIESFNPILVKWYKDNRPDIRRGLLITDIVKTNGFSVLNVLLSGMIMNCIAKPDFIAYDITKRRALPIFLCTRLYGNQRFTWTIRTSTQLDEAKEEKSCPIFENIVPKN